MSSERERGVGGAAGELASGLPERGLCAHRGAMELWPENTLSGFTEALRLGAHMIELDVRLSRDGHPIVIHDQTVERTTNGKGEVAELTLPQIREFAVLDAAHPERPPQRLATLAEVLAIMPRDVWVNIHLKGKADSSGWWSRWRRFWPGRASQAQTGLARIVTRLLADAGRLSQAFLACGGAHAAAARQEHADVQICYLLRGSDSQRAVREAIDFGAQWIQLSARRPPTPELVELLKRHRVRITYGFADSPEGVRDLFARGIDFPLVNNIQDLMPHAGELGLPATRRTVG
jgi:glycerophosphoryl diester phosphodiesterase